MKKILVALDYSLPSKNAFEYALLLAKDLKADLMVLNVVLTVINTGIYPQEIIDFAKANEQHRATTLLKKLTTYYPNKDSEKFLEHNVSISYAVKEGAFAPTIIQTAATLNCELIIAGTKTGHQLSKIILGSTVKELIRKTIIPALIIPQNYAYQSIKNIAFATTLDGKDEAAILWLRKWANLFPAMIQPFFVSGLPYDYSDKKEEIWESNSLPAEGDKKPTVTVIRKMNIKAGIEYYLQQHPTDILAMFIPKRSFLNQFFHISKTQQMVMNADLPLLIYRAQKR